MLRLKEGVEECLVSENGLDEGVVVLFHPEEILPSPAHPISLAFALGRIGDRTVGEGAVGAKKLGKRALHVSGVMRTILQIEPRFVEEPVVPLFFVQASVAAPGPASGDSLGYGPVDQKRHQSLPQLLLVRPVHSVVAFWALEAKS